MRISDWSSDVCSSDLVAEEEEDTPPRAEPKRDAGIVSSSTEKAGMAAFSELAGVLATSRASHGITIEDLAKELLRRCSGNGSTTIFPAWSKRSSRPSFSEWPIGPTSSKRPLPVLTRPQTERTQA